MTMDIAARVCACLCLLFIDFISCSYYSVQGTIYIPKYFRIIIYRYILLLYVTDGKSALRISASYFNEVASTTYKGISDEYKQHLTGSSGPRIQQMSRKSLMKCGEAFKNIQKEVYYT